jgi:hypothetical protein
MDTIRSRLHLKSRRDFLEAVAWLVLVVTGLVMSLEFDVLQPGYDLTPAFWPRVILIVAGVFAVVLLASSISATPPSGTEAPATGEAAEGRSVNLHVLVVFAVPLLYVYAMHKIGFLLVTPVFLPLYMYVLGVRRWPVLAGVTVFLYALIIVLFVKLVFTPLPQGAGVFHSLNGELMGLLQ